MRTLSQYLGTPAPAAAPGIDWPKPVAGMTKTSAMFPYLNFLLQFCPTHPSEKAILSSRYPAVWENEYYMLYRVQGEEAAL